MVNVFGDSIASRHGNLQMVKKVVVAKTIGIKYSKARYYDGKVYVLDDVAMMEVSDWHLATDTISSRLVYFVMGVVVLLCKEIEDPLELEV